MKETDIIYAWKENGGYHQKKINRKVFYVMFDGLAKGFDKLGDNDISKKMIAIIPDVDLIVIDKDNNETQEIPAIVYNINGNPYMLKIMRRNTIVWSILNKYCTEE